MYFDREVVCQQHSGNSDMVHHLPNELDLGIKIVVDHGCGVSHYFGTWILGVSMILHGFVIFLHPSPPPFNSTELLSSAFID